MTQISRTHALQSCILTGCFFRPPSDPPALSASRLHLVPPLWSSVINSRPQIAIRWSIFLPVTLRSISKCIQLYKSSVWPALWQDQTRDGEVASYNTMEIKPVLDDKAQAPTPTKGKRILGLRPKWFWAAILLLAAICIAVGVGVGVGVGVTRKYETQVFFITSYLTRKRSPSTEKKSLEALEKYRKENNFPALAVGKSTLQEPFKSQVTGVRKEGDPTPVLITDQFHLGSNTKAMTATLLAIIIQEAVGNLTWQSTLVEALPAISNVSEGHRSTTLEMLTSHHSGIYDELWRNDPNYRLSLYPLSPTEGRRSITQRLLSAPPAKAQGKFEYDNANYVIAGFIIETVTNTTFEEVASSRLFKPLGMSSAGFGPLPESSNTSIDNPWPHTMEFSSPIPPSVTFIYRDNSPAIASAGGAYCTLSDYDKFLRMHLDGVHGRINASSPLNLSTASFRHLHTVYPGQDEGNSYTFGGWIRQNTTTKADDYELSHDGSNTLYFASVKILMRPDAAYMAMTNVANDDLQDIATAIHSVIDGINDGILLDY